MMALQWPKSPTPAPQSDCGHSHALCADSDGVVA